MAFKLARLAQVKLLIVDEVQDLLNITPRQRVLALMGIKDVMNTLLLPIVAFGTPEARFALEADQHLNARFAFRELPVWKADDYFRHFLESFETGMPLERPSNLGSITMMRLIIKSTKGLMANIVSRLQTAAVLAVEEGEERVTADLFIRSEYEVPTSDNSLLPPSQ